MRGLDRDLRLRMLSTERQMRSRHRNTIEERRLDNDTAQIERKFVVDMKLFYHERRMLRNSLVSLKVRRDEMYQQIKHPWGLCFGSHRYDF